MIRRFLQATALLLLPVLAQGQVKMLRHPTYSKGKVAFSYLGDIWIANENGSGVERLTVNNARDQFPRFSPDGQWVAFSSNREGNYDVFVISAAGGEPRQLTFHSADDNVVGWTPDGKNIIFSSTRGNGAFPTVATLWGFPRRAALSAPSIPTGAPGPAIRPTAPSSPSSAIPASGPANIIAAPTRPTCGWRT